MKIVKQLNDPFSAILSWAIVEVEANEASDIEDMLALLDGQIGHFGIKAELIGTKEFNPKWVQKRKDGTIYIQGQFGFSSAEQLKKEKRYYDVMVSRD